MNRRSFLNKLLLLGPAVYFSEVYRARAAESVLNNTTVSKSLWLPAGRKVSMMQGMTDESSAQIFVLAPRSEKVLYTATNSSGKALTVQILAQNSIYNSKFQVDHLLVAGLAVGEINSILVRDSAGKLIDTRKFKAVDLSSSRAKIALISCMNDQASNQSEMWDAVIAQNPDVLFFLGDNVYADSADLPISHDHIWLRYIETRLTLDIFQAELLIPVIAIWDDHDYAEDDGGMNFSLKKETLSVFKSFFGNQSRPNFTTGPGVASVLRAFGQRFVFLDDRSFRDSSQGMQWGDNQIQWMLSQLDASTLEPIWILNGSQFHGGYHRYESVQRESPKELQKLIQSLRTLKAPVVLAAGDVHYSEVMKLEPQILGYPSLELTSSAIHSPEADSTHQNQRRVFATAQNNFMIVETQAQPLQVDMRISIVGTRGSILYSGNHMVRKGS